MYGRRIIILGAAILSGGCASTETNPGRITTWQLLCCFDRLQAHIGELRRDNDELLVRALALERQTADNMKIAGDLRRQIAVAHDSLKVGKLESERIQEELKRREQRLMAANMRIERIKLELQKSRRALADEQMRSEEAAAAEEKMRAQRFEMDAMQRNVDFVRKTIKDAQELLIIQDLRERVR